jgi:hypothetical protein
MLVASVVDSYTEMISVAVKVVGVVTVWVVGVVTLLDCQSRSRILIR